MISKIIKFEVGFKAVNHLPRPQLFWISQKPNLIFVLLYIEGEKIKVMCLLFTDGKQHKARKLNMIILRNHVPQSHEMITCDLECP